VIVRSLVQLQALLLLLLSASSVPSAEPTLPATQPLTIKQPIDEIMVAGIQRYCLREIARAEQLRNRIWERYHSLAGGHKSIMARTRKRLMSRLGVVDTRLTASRPGRQDFTLLTDTPLAVGQGVRLHAVRWVVLDGVTAEGLLLTPQRPRAAVVALPDADWSPSEFCGLTGQLPRQLQLARRLANAGCLVVIPTLINRSDEHSGHPAVAFTNQPHREFLYRQAFEMGRHLIGYEVQKILAAVDLFEQLPSSDKQLPIGVVGIGEGGLLSLYAAALDPRIQSTLVSGYFQQRDEIWQQPIYRNVWGLLNEFGDAELAGMVMPRGIVIEAAAAVEVAGPPKPRPGRRDCAAPGRIVNCKLSSVEAEFKKAVAHFQRWGQEDRLVLAVSGDSGTGPAGTNVALTAFLDHLGINDLPAEDRSDWELSESLAARSMISDQAEQDRQQRQFVQLQDHVQLLIERSDDVRATSWQLDASNPAEAAEQLRAQRRTVHRDLIGMLTEKRLAANPRSRLLLETEDFVAYEIMLDVLPDVIAGGILLMPSDIQPGERRPVVVCQHGLEGTAMDTISSDPRSYRLYKSFSRQLCERGFIVYAPQNPYRGLDEFRVIQRMANPVGRSLFSFIISQHEQTIDWLSSLPEVDPSRIAFYGLSYGGKTAMRVPPLVKRYCLSICSGDFTDWPRVIATNSDPHGYIFTREYEIFEWNLGHVASYAELAMLMTPRPFMVEQGLRDGGTPVEWVKREYEKVRRHYNQLGIGEQTEIEFFDGPHTIHGVGTFRFLHKHLAWPATTP